MNPTENTGAQPLNVGSFEIGEMLTKEVSAQEKPESQPLNPDSFEQPSRAKKDAYMRQERIINNLYTEVIRNRDGLEVALDEIDKLETLSTGKELSSTVVGEDESGVNVTRCVKFEKNLVGFVKSGKGEAIIGKRGVVMAWDERAQGYVEQQDPQTPGLREISSEKYKNNMLEAIKNTYGLSDEEVESMKRDMFGEYVGVRADIPPRESVVHEMAVGQLAKLCDLDRFPQTILRKQEGEFLSVQEGASSKIPGERLRGPSEEDLALLLEVPVDQWKDRIGEDAAKNLKRAIDQGAIATELFGFQDLGANNILMNAKTGEMTFIDNSLSFGLLRGKEVKGESVEARAFRSIRSLPLEILKKNPEYKLDQEVRQKLANLQADIFKRDAESPEKQVLEECMKTLFPNLKIAKGQLKEFLGRLNNIVKTGTVAPKNTVDGNWKSSPEETLLEVSQYALDQAKLRKLQEQAVDNFDGDIPEATLKNKAA